MIRLGCLPGVFLALLLVPKLRAAPGATLPSTSRLFGSGILFRCYFRVLNQLPHNDGSQEPANARGGSPLNQVGRIAAGGRCDDLVGIFGKRHVPGVGVSFGVGRIFIILDARRQKKASVLTREIDIYVMSIGGSDSDGLLLERLAVACELWDAGIRAEFSAKLKAKRFQQFRAAKDAPLAAILGDEGLANCMARLKIRRTGDDETDEKDRGQRISRDKLVSEIKRLL